MPRELYDVRVPGAKCQQAGCAVLEKFVKGDIKLGFIITKGQLEISVVCAKGLPKNINHQKPGKSMSDIHVHT